MDESVESPAPDSCSGEDSINLSVLNWEQVQRLDTILTASIPIHGRWSFPTLEVKPRDIVKVVRSRMEEKRIQVREVRLNGSAASYVLHEDSGLGWKDLDLIFCADISNDEHIYSLHPGSHGVMLRDRRTHIFRRDVLTGSVCRGDSLPIENAKRKTLFTNPKIFFDTHVYLSFKTSKTKQCMLFFEVPRSSQKGGDAFLILHHRVVSGAVELTFSR